jgi:hypothetical protein
MDEKDFLLGIAGLGMAATSLAQNGLTVILVQPTDQSLED